MNLARSLRLTVYTLLLLGTALILALTSGCSSGRTDAACTGPDYLGSIAKSRWDKPVVTYSIEHTRTITPEHDRDKATEEGVLRWQGTLAKAGVRLERTNDPESADIRIRYVSHARLLEEEGRAEKTRGPLSDLLSHLFPDLLGYTGIDLSPRLTLTHADVFLFEGLAYYKEAGVTAHEVGHALGLRGHSGCASDLMYYIVPLPPWHGGNPNGRDQATLLRCYTR